MCITRLRDENGFTLMELLVASTITVVVLGSAVAMTSQIQNGYRRQLEDSAAEQEARYVLEWIGRYVRGAANNPTAAPTTACPGPAVVNVRPIQFDPGGDDIDNDIRLMTDANPPDGLIGGPAGVCDQSGEDVTISIDSDANTITFLDNNTGGEITTRTDTVIENLEFVFRNSTHGLIDTSVANAAANVVYVETRITIRSRTIDPASGAPATRTLSQEVKIRSRG
ncbi:MAG TPA: prepilin-type N-terminal cleavage/methylation domain-containing protein [Vicinamibacterales bacterium]|jgi:prepilin-type N-terminal cleavage/methylation domain-containing protein|nr:prepilin-type N-terminal cleavage/methylation domain-containing protein [Vicinamibacterales bacterium]